ncbi:carbon starvation CstA family protein [Calderihabitans maritimus]|uniref:Carbon starvation protein CstA n=1 Tax=Calderihabitans maritimus TaxID=1246530 RepID=A0A1Z5HQU9_9FIRM|nr:carbon starvation protein A [Calderihabitans maritimus]GAW91691.1 carbon starvation protein CstA [Calderihabitans maritimus]
MVTFFAAIALLIGGYFVYGAFVERVFGVDENRETPAQKMQDGVDYVPLDWKKNSLIQLLNIAGLGPIFGPIAGALWGPVAFIWIAIGGIVAGAVHDYFSGMLSMRNNGSSLPETVGTYLGSGMKKFVNIFAIVLLILVGAVFMAGPAKLLAALTPESMSVNVWLAVILVYYFIATILPIDKIIGRLYPLFGASLLIMAFGIMGGLLIKGYQIPELTFANLHPKGLPIWPLMFVTIACGAISGFHATQSPIIARCVQNEKHGRRIFYGAMIAESIIAMIWAAAAMTFFGGSEGLAAVLSKGGPAGVVNEISNSLLGVVGGLLAVLGVIVLPITSGDTAFRATRLIIAEIFRWDQKSTLNRLKIALPLFAVGFTLTQIDFSILWRYFAWSNQTMAMIVLWAAAVYLAKNERLHWVASLPATFMTAVSATYILQAPEGFSLPTSISYPVGIIVALLVMAFFLYKTGSRMKMAAEAQS